MPLLAKIRTLRRRRRPAPPRSKAATLNRRAFWACVALGTVGLFALYFWVTTAKILQDPIVLEFGPADATFTSAFGPIVGAEFTGGNATRLLVNGDEIFPAMLEAIAHAEKSITLETYIWAPGHISEKFISALRERARAGVKVHVLVDGMGTLKFDDHDRERLREDGVEIFKYGREHWYEVKPNINHRTHRKLLIVDGRVGFTGGMCIDDAWLGDATQPDHWRETGIRVEGPAVRQMQAVFATNWLQTTSHLLIGEEYYPKIEAAGESLALCFKSGPSEGPESARVGYLFAIAAARESIDISHAYFVPDDLAIDTLIAAKERGVRVRVVVPAINDSSFGRAASRSRWRRLLEAGVELHLFQPAMYHCKTMVVDGVLTTIGSANFDNRSFSINDEVTLNVLDRDLAAQHTRMFEADLAQSRRMTFAEYEARPLRIKLADKFCGLFRSQL